MKERGIPVVQRDLILQWVVDGRLSGKFLSSLFENNLMETYIWADAENREMLFAYLELMYNDLPADCWGSRDAVQRWYEHGGLRGANGAGYRVAVEPIDAYCI